jgi:hypothetical protein
MQLCFLGNPQINIACLRQRLPLQNWSKQSHIELLSSHTEAQPHGSMGLKEAVTLESNIIPKTETAIPELV